MDRMLGITSKGSESTLVLAHHVGHMRSGQVATAGLVAEVYRNQLQSGGRLQLMPEASYQAPADVAHQAALPKAVQDRLKKEHKLREKQRLQQQEAVKARQQALRDQHQENGMAEAVSAAGDHEQAKGSHGAEQVITQPPDMLPHQMSIPGSGMLAWTEWLGKNPAIKSKLSFHTQLHT